MPLYEYKCHSCGKTFEVIQKFSDEPLKIHAECGGPVERLLSAPAFHLKGSGWYATDYGKGGAKSGKSDDSKDSKESKSETKAEKSDSGSGKSESSAPAADSKPASTTESKPSKPSTAA
ncbi:MAG TPA: FmdB family zinc ribbon protein [Bryobacteraceae bacterium]|jgi:putative FmdB family regulatory protein|nr:FmdB family zinc ribbon protein [Bryobacteraceae bacterium]